MAQKLVRASRTKKQIIMLKSILSASLILLSIAGNAQSDKSKKVKTQYMQLPSYDVSVTSPSSIGIEFAMNEVSYGTEKLKDTKSKCMPKGGGLKDIIEITAYHYEVPQTLPESYVVAKSLDGTIVYAVKSSEVGASSVKFGWDDKMKQSLCEYWQAAQLKKDWASKATLFKDQEAEAYEEKIYKKAYAEAVNNVSINYVLQEFSVFTEKGKVFNYSELDLAFENALTAYEGISENGYNEKDFGILKESIVVWEKELASADLENKKARINRKIAKGLEENCTRAYFHIMDYDNAKKHAEAFDKLFGNMSTTRSQNFELVAKRIRLQSVAASKNKSSLNDIAALNAKATAEKGDLAGKKLESINVERLKTDYNTLRSTQSLEVAYEVKQGEADAIASGELNPYQKFYIDAAAGGAGVIMSLPPSTLSGIPELTEFPKEICQFTEAKQVVILKNKIASIPAEISKMTNLKKLNLSNNKLTDLPAEIGTLGNLETLKLANNPLESLPAELANCKNLKSLVLKGTKIPADQIKELQAKLPNCKIKI